MTAALQPTPAEHGPGATSLELVAEPSGARDLVQSAAEHTMLRGVVIGTVVGMILGALFWAGLVAASLAGGGDALAGAVWMGAAVGVFGGAFIGGWVGVVATTGVLEEAEHHTRCPA